MSHCFLLNNVTEKTEIGFKCNEVQDDKLRQRPMVANFPGRACKCTLSPMDGNEDGERGHKEPKVHILIAELGCILESPSLKNKNKMESQYQQTLWEGGMKTALSTKKQNQASLEL